MSGHLVAEKTRAEKTDPAWYKATAQVGTFVNTRAVREDILAYLGPDAGQGHAACFCPDIAEIELNVEICFGAGANPKAIGDLNERATLYEYPVAAGALIHEAAHARWTVWPLTRMRELAKERKSDLVPRLIETAEESRIEGLAVMAWPEDTAFLRASAMEIIVADIDFDKLKEGSPYAISSTMLLTMARHDAGVLANEDVADLEKFFREFFTSEVYDQFREIWRRMQRIGRHDPLDHAQAFDLMIPLADEWMKLLPEDPDRADERMQAALKSLEALGELLEQTGGSVTVGAMDELIEQQVQEAWDELVKKDKQVANEVAQHADVADQVFGSIIGHGDMPLADSRSRIVGRRSPRPQEVAAAIEISRQLDRARYRARIVVDTRTIIPPGRLSTRDAVQGMAQRAAGRIVTATPWQQRLRRHVEDPSLKIGVMVDISGSMSGAMEPMAVTAWLLAEAGHRIQAQVAMVYFGQGVFPTLKPGQRMPEVIVYSAPDGVERFDRGFKALDGRLNLLHGSGARLLVICSDMGYSGQEPVLVKRWTTRCLDAGVGVLSLPFDGGWQVEDKGLDSRVQVIKGTLDPVAAATVIGQAGVRALEQANVQR